MSIKIYDCWKYRGDVKRFMPRLIAFREKVNARVDAILLNHFHPGCGTAPVDGDYWNRVESEIAKNLKSGVRDKLNVSCSIGLFPHPEVPGLLFRAFGIQELNRNDDFMGANFDLRGCFDWYYTDSHDMPEVSREIRKKRKREWLTVLPDFRNSQRWMLVFELIPEDFACTLTMRIRRKYEAISL